MTEKKTFSIRMRPALMKALRRIGVEEEKALADLLEEAVTELIKKYSQKKGV